jgi:hypothetical protein
MPFWLTSRTFPTFIRCLLLPPLPPYQTLSSHLYKALVLCPRLLIVRPDSHAYCSSRQSLLVMLGFFRAANSIRWAIASPQLKQAPFAKGSSAVKRPNSISADLSCSSLAFFLIAPTFDLRLRSTSLGCGHAPPVDWSGGHGCGSLASPFPTPDDLDRDP